MKIIIKKFSTYFSLFFLFFTFFLFSVTSCGVDNPTVFGGIGDSCAYNNPPKNMEIFLSLFFGKLLGKFISLISFFPFKNFFYCFVLLIFMGFSKFACVLTGTLFDMEMKSP
jgi:hypothetical protein